MSLCAELTRSFRQFYDTCVYDIRYRMHLRQRDGEYVCREYAQSHCILIRRVSVTAASKIEQQKRHARAAPSLHLNRAGNPCRSHPFTHEQTRTQRTSDYD